MPHNGHTPVRQTTVRVKTGIKSLICPANAHTNCSKIFELLRTFKSTITAPTCFGLHKPSSGGSQSVLRQSYNIDLSVHMSLMKFLVPWLHILFRPVVCVYCALCRVKLCNLVLVV